MFFFFIVVHIIIFIFLLLKVFKKKRCLFVLGNNLQNIEQHKHHENQD